MTFTLLAPIVKNALECRVEEDGVSRVSLSAMQKSQWDILGMTERDMQEARVCDPLQDAVQALFFSPWFVLATAMLFGWAWLTHSNGNARPITVSDQRWANWYILNGVYIHFLMDGMVGAVLGTKAWRLMGREYSFLDRRFHPNAHSVAAQCTPNPDSPCRDLPLNWSVPHVVGLIELTLDFVLCMACYMAIKQKLPWRRVAEIVLLTSQAVGAIVFVFVEESTGGTSYFGNTNDPFKHKIFDQQGNIDPHQLFYYWFGLVINYLWVVIPVIGIYYRGLEASEGVTGESLGELGLDIEVEDMLADDDGEEFEGDEDDYDEDDEDDVGDVDVLSLGRRAAARAAAAASIVAMAAVEAAADRAAEASLLDGEEDDDEELETHDSLLQAMIQDGAISDDEDDNEEEEEQEQEEEPQPATTTRRRTRQANTKKTTDDKKRAETPKRSTRSSRRRR